MLSRLARLAPTAQRGLPALTRPFHTSKPVANLYTPEEVKGPSGTIVDTPGIIDQYGAIPFVGLLATALVSKEVFIIDEAFLLACNTATVATVAYIGIGSGANDFFEAERTKDNNRFHDAFNAVLESINLYKSVETKKLEKVGVIRDLCTESREVNVAYLKFLDIKQRHEARKAMISKLEAIQKRESQEEAHEYQAMVTEAIEAVRASYTDASNTALRQASLEYAIKSVGNVTDLESDPVRIALLKTIDQILGDELGDEAE